MRGAIRGGALRKLIPLQRSWMTCCMWKTTLSYFRVRNPMVIEPVIRLSVTFPCRKCTRIWRVAARHFSAQVVSSLHINPGYLIIVFVQSSAFEAPPSHAPNRFSAHVKITRSEQRRFRLLCGLQLREILHEAHRCNR